MRSAHFRGIGLVSHEEGELGHLRAENVRKEYEDLPSGSSPTARTTYILPRRIVGLFWSFTGKKHMKIQGNPAGGTQMIGAWILGSTNPQESGSPNALALSSASGTTIFTSGPAFVPVAGSTYFLSFQGYGDLQGTQPYEINAGDSTRRRIYGEIVSVASVSGSGPYTLTLTNALARTYTNQSSLALYNAGTSSASEDIEVADVSVYGNAPFTTTAISFGYQYGLTLTRVHAYCALNQGINIVRCRNVALNDCGVQWIFKDPRASGSGYGVEVDFSVDVTISNLQVAFCRYGVSIARGSTNVKVDGMRIVSIFADTGATADVHGGDCKNITIKNIFAPTITTKVGNASWRRGVNGGLIDNCTAYTLGYDTSVRKFSTTDSIARRMTLYTSSADTAGGFMNADGADQPFPSSSNWTGTTIQWVEDSDLNISKYPLQIYGAPSVNLRASKLTFDKCEFLQDWASATSGSVVANNAFQSSTSNQITFTDCNFRVKSVNQYTVTTGSGGPIDFTFDQCTFERPGSYLTSLLTGTSSQTALIKCSYYGAVGSPTTKITGGNVGTLVAGVVPTVDNAGCP